MTRYFFHTEDGKCLADEEGTELPSAEAAKREGVRLLGEILAESGAQFWATESFKVIVTDNQGLVVFILQVGATVSPAYQRRTNEDRWPRLVRGIDEAPEGDHR